MNKSKQIAKPTPCNEYVVSDCCDHHFRLQAAAPELLELIKEFVMHIKVTTRRQAEWDKKAMAAIRKAEGRE